eukprot:GHVP01035215.1.p1 GENE.GHVP01035215.1~~GHVP01035215.1.p1  ORF type:complete len:259 (-),score=46.64 GHVP01035215.1:104-838(-)
MKKKEILFEASLTAASGLAGISIPQENFVCSHTAHCSSSHQDAGMIFEKIYSGLHFSQGLKFQRFYKDLSQSDKEILDKLVSLEQERSGNVLVYAPPPGGKDFSSFLVSFSENWNNNFSHRTSGFFEEKNTYYKKDAKLPICLLPNGEEIPIKDVFCAYSDTTRFISIGINKEYKHIFLLPNEAFDLLDAFFFSFALNVRPEHAHDLEFSFKKAAVQLNPCPSPGSSATAEETDSDDVDFSTDI